MIASAQTLRLYKPVKPFVERTVAFGMSYGLSYAGYDIRVADSLRVDPGDFRITWAIEKFEMPDNLLGIVHDKSTWARQGLSVFNTVIEPGWNGWLTLELANHNQEKQIILESGMPIAQVIFHKLDSHAEEYKGKYQNQEQGAQEARYEN